MSSAILQKCRGFGRLATPAFAPGRSFLAPTGTRTLVTGGPKEFLCIMPDKPDVLEIRKKVKELHYQGIKPLIDSGKIVAGGGIFESHPEEEKPLLFKGSVVVYTGESSEAVRGIIEKDIYATSGVWDLSKAQIIPYVPAVRQSLGS